MLKKFDVVHFGFKLLLMVILIVFLPTLAEARWSFTPRIYVEEQYDDNLFLTEKDEQDDFIITVSPGGSLNYQVPTGEIDLDYEFRRSFYADFSELDFSSHRGRARARKDFGSWLSAGIRETFIRSEDPVELTGIAEFERPTIRTGRRKRYTRNIVEPEATVRFGEDRSIRLGYRNTILEHKREDIADQNENAANALLTYRFNIRNGLAVFYEHKNREYQETVPPSTDRDHDGDEIRGRYTYYFDPKTSAFVGYRYYQRDFDTETGSFFDYKVHNPSLGFARDLYENVTLSASVGYVIRDVEGRGDDEVFYGRVNLSAEYKRLILSLYGETGVDEDFLSAESLGFKEFWRAGINGRYQLLERLRVRAYFYIEEEDFVDRPRREDTLWSFRGSLDYQVLRWLFLSLHYDHNERDSNIPLESYEDNRYFGRILVQYDIAELL